MKKLILLIFIFLPACTFKQLPSAITNANTGVIKTETRPVSGFTGIKVANNIALELTVGADFNISVEGDENLLKMLTTEVEEGNLTIALGEKISRSNKVAIKVSMPELKELEVSGGSTALVTGVKGAKLRLQANGAAKIRISGEVKDLEARAHGGSVIEAEALKTSTADVEALGATTVTVSPAVSLKAVTAGMSAVTYTGNPKVEKNTSNTSTVKKKD